MASNVGRMGLRSGSPSFLVIGLSLVIVVLLYSYWSVSSRNGMLLRDQTFLQDRLRTLSSQKVKVEQKYVAARSQMTDVEKAKRKLEQKDLSSSQKQSQLDSKIKGLENELRAANERLQSARKQGEKSKSELAKLKTEIETTNQKFREISDKAKSMLKIHQQLKEKFQQQSQELLNAKSDKEMLNLQLDRAKGEPKHNQREPQPNANLTEDKNEPKQRQIPVQQNKEREGESKGHQNLGKKFPRIRNKLNRLKQKLVPGLNDLVNATKREELKVNTSKSTINLNTTKDIPNALVNKPNNTATPSVNVSGTATTSEVIHSNTTTLKPTEKSVQINASKSYNVTGKMMVPGGNVDSDATKTADHPTTTANSTVAPNVEEITPQPSEKPTTYTNRDNADAEEDDPHARNERRLKNSVIRGRPFKRRSGKQKMLNPLEQ